MASLNTAQISDYINKNYPGLSTDPNYIQTVMNQSGGGNPDQIASAIQNTPQYQTYNATNTQNATNQAEQGFTSSLTNTINNLPTPTQTYNSLANTLGITGTQTALTNAENNLNMIPTNTQANATSMGGISAPQIAARENQQASLVSPVVQSLSNTLGIENQNLGTLFQGQEQQNQNQLLPYQYQAQFLGQNAQNSYNLMSTEEQQAFQNTYSQLQTQETISEEQANAAIQLANQLKLYGQYPSLTGSSILNPAILQALGGTLGTNGNFTGTGNFTPSITP